MFWGSDNESPRPVRVVDELPQMLPNPVLCCQSLSVRATAYGLLTYSLRREFIIEPIVQWLNARRQAHSSWAGPVDSALAIEALVMYSLTSMQSVNSLSVSVEFKGAGKSKTRLLTLNEKEMGPHLITLDNFYGHVKVEVSGEGKAVMQLSNRYTVRNENGLADSPVKAFEQKQDVQLSQNNDELNLKTCHR